MLLHQGVLVRHELRNLVGLLKLNSTFLMSMIGAHFGFPQSELRPEGKVRLVPDLRMGTFQFFHQRVPVCGSFFVELIVLEHRLLLEGGLLFNEALQLVDSIVDGWWFAASALDCT